MAATTGPRYAPPDPTLPKPWRELIDGDTGNHYFWNRETGVTQYDRPEVEILPPTHPGPPPRKRDRDDVEHYSGWRSHQGIKGSEHHYRTADVGDGSAAEAYRRKHEIVVRGDDVPDPFTTFEAADFPAELLREVHRAGFSAPTPIQAQSWPIALGNRDIVAVAKTGSGKTLGYLFPGFVHLKNLPNSNRAGPLMLVLAPTRELATQIRAEADKFGRSSRISCTCLCGGGRKGPQLRDLDRGVDVVVATPGRLNEMIESRKVSLHQVAYVVLDEADRMLDMGFEPQIRKIMKEISYDHQTLMFTATWPKEVQKIAADLLVNPIQVNIGGTDILVANNSITQHVEVITPREKQRRLEQILRSQDRDSKVLIFCSTKRLCEELSRNLRRFGVATIHGDKSQNERDRVLTQFRTGRSLILVATDVASRGLDIKDIRVVINYDFPTDIEDYVHRIGRTGRAGATGVSYTFFCKKDSNYALDLIKVLEGANQNVPPELEGMVSHGRNRRRFKRNLRRWRSSPRGRDKGHCLGRHSDSYAEKGGLNEPSYRARGRSRGRSFSPSSMKLRVGRGNSSPNPTKRGGNSRSRSRCRSISQGVSRDAGPVCKHSPLSKRKSSTDNTSRSRSRSPQRSISQGVSRDAGPVRKHSPLFKRESSTDNTSSSRSRSPSRSIIQGYNRGSVPARTQSPALLDQNLETFPKHHGNREETDEDMSQKTLNGSLRMLSLSPENWEETEDQIQQTSPNHRGVDDVKEVGNGPVGTPLSCLDSEEEIEEGMISDD